jgi:hypothetical protein
MNDGSTRTGQDAIMTCRRLPRSVPLKAYVGFDPENTFRPPPVVIRSRLVRVIRSAL